MKKCMYCSEHQPMENHDLCEPCAEFLYEIEQVQKRELEEQMEKEFYEKTNGYID